MRLFEWEELSEGETLSNLQTWMDRTLPQFTLESVRYIIPSFYQDTVLAWLTVLNGESDPGSLYLLVSENGEIVPLDFTSNPILTYGYRNNLNLNEETALDYLLFFVSFVATYPMQFQLIRSAEDIPLDTDALDHEEFGSPEEYLKRLERLLVETELEETEVGNEYLVQCNILSDGDLYHCLMHLYQNGMVSMTEDEAVMEYIPTTSSHDPILFGRALHKLMGSSYSTASSRSLTTKQSAGNVDAHVMEIINRVLLTEALAKLDDTVFFPSEVSAKIDDHSLFDDFAQMLVDTKPVIIIESPFPFFEEVIGKTITNRNDIPLKLVRPNLNNNYNGEINSIGLLSKDQLLTLPIHSYRIGNIAEMVSHEISMIDSVVFIGCHTTHDVPEALQRIVDLVIPVPSINEFNFKKIFEELYGHSVPGSQTKDLRRWVNQVLPTDFQQPFRLEMDVHQIIPFIKERVQKRIKEVSSESGPGLDDLYGLGEAKHVATDLIADIQAAKKGVISWDKVDKGLLMVGPPGTGKTTLARAIAKESGLKFINASAAEWQMADHLGYHLMNIRKDFALARRYAPSILFIDELDSIGNRGDFTGKNAGYQTQIVNALLSEIQGFNDEDEIIVIGATNYLEKIDPALRRAGRLDQIAHVSYPNIKALTKIYGYYLDPILKDRKDLDKQQLYKELAQLSFGCTGADVEEYVRGASRRARKNGREIQKEDLIDEITGKSRSETGTLRMNQEEMKRVAIHEAGHALARILSDTKGQDISFVSIVPRSNGSLGFVASIPDEKAMYTRKDYLSLLEVILAGRAAEQIVYGHDLISGGAGGSSSSDLAKATAIARDMITKHGLGNENELYWSRDTGKDDISQIKKLLKATYKQVLTKLEAEQEKLEAISEILVDEQEIEGRALLDQLK